MREHPFIAVTACVITGTISLQRSATMLNLTINESSANSDIWEIKQVYKACVNIGK